jgi:dihydrofolate reductase
MPVAIIAAVAANRVIGDRGKLPWRLPDDLARFKQLTMGHALVMGRATFASIGRPLSSRRNLVLSHDLSLWIDGCEVVHSLDEAVRSAGGEELFVIGGASVYALFLPIADRMFLTHVDQEVPGDTLFPEVPWDQWRVTAEAPGAEPREGRPPHRFVDYQRIR